MSRGFSSKRLERIAQVIDSYVARGRYPGALCSVVRHGEEVFYHEIGQRDLERGTAMTRDTIFRIYSMTKPITSVALMMLYEQGRFQLDDPVSKYIPAWRDLKVLSGSDDAALAAEPASVPMTIKHLLTHTSGLTYGFMDDHPLALAYRERGIGGLACRGTLDDLIADLADLPLLFTPGTRWNYGVSTDVCGYLVQQFADLPLDEFIRERITGPLGMHDTDFHVGKDKAHRFAACYEYRDGDRFTLSDDPGASIFNGRPTFFSGGSGMVSTLDDYQRFVDMLRNGGELNGVRLLGPRTLAYMKCNHMPGNRDLAAMGQAVFSETPYDGIGFGLGFSVVLDPATANVLCSSGEYAWGGIASTAFWIDPREDLSLIFMTQLVPSSSYPIRRELKTALYQALID